jgi:hypothetical protein
VLEKAGKGLGILPAFYSDDEVRERACCIDSTSFAAGVTGGICGGAVRALRLCPGRIAAARAFDGQEIVIRAGGRLPGNTSGSRGVCPCAVGRVAFVSPVIYEDDILATHEVFRAAVAGRARSAAMIPGRRNKR